MTKTCLKDLAILGAAPAFPEKLHVGRPNIGDRERFIARVNDILDRRWLTNQGKYVQEFETRLASLLRVKHCIAICNATAALEIAVRALGLKGEVIIPSFTFIATAHALQWQEITPVFCDIDPHTHTLDPACVEPLITPHTTGIIGVHLWGRPCNVEALTDIAARNRLELLFDAAHALACSSQGRMIGNFGHAEIFSFHATKFITTGEGGAIATNDDTLATRVRLMKNFGFVGYDNVTHIGTNGKLNEIAAALGLISLESVDDFVTVNRRNYHQYQSELRYIPGIRLLTYDETEKCNYQYVVLEVHESVAQVSRDQLVDVLVAENVIARRYFYPGCHRMDAYLSYYPGARRSLPVTEDVADRVLCLPTGTAVGPDEIALVSQIIRTALSGGQEFSAQLRELRSAL